MMTIIEKPLSEIKPYWRNPRKNEETVIALTHSIHRYGFNVPLVIDEDGVIITGHARYKALTKMHRETVPCVVMSGSPEKIQKFRILDNEIQDQSSWDMDKLIEEIEAMPEYDDMIHSFKGSLDSMFAFMDEHDGSLGADVDSKLIELEEAGESLPSQITINKVECPFCGYENPLDENLKA